MTPQTHILFVEGRTIKPRDPKTMVVATSVAADAVQLVLDEPALWEGLDLHLTFEGSGELRRVAWDGSSRVTVPWECCAKASGHLRITLVGNYGSETKAITARMGITLKVADPGSDTTTLPAEPTEDEYATAVRKANQAAADASEAAAAATEAAEDVSEAKEAAESAASAATDAAAAAGEAATAATSAAGSAAGAAQAASEAAGAANEAAATATSAAGSATDAATAATAAAGVASEAATSANNAADSVNEAIASADAATRAATSAATAADSAAAASRQAERQRAETFAALVADYDHYLTHVCAAGEYDAETLRPTVADPSPIHIYLVPDPDAEQDADSVYLKWVWLPNDDGGRWELFGGTGGETVAYVAYDANGGTGGVPEGGFALVGSAYTVELTPAPTRAGHTFLGWDENPTSATATYHDGATAMQVAGSVTLYAVWRAHSYSVAYEANGGTGTTEGQTFTYGEAHTLRACGFTRPLMLFDGWNTAQDGSGTTYGSTADNGAVAVGDLTAEDGATVTLWAQWADDDRRTLTYDANGGSGEMASQAVTAKTDQVAACGFTGATVTATLDLGEGTGTPSVSAVRQFTGWNTAANGSGTSIDPGDEVRPLMSLGPTIELYAQWADVTLALPEPTPPEGRLFDGWEDAQGDPVTSPVTISTDATYAATYRDEASAVVYGFELDPNNSDPATCVTYIEGNASFAPAAMNYSTGSFGYGDWDEPFFMPTPVILGFDGAEVCELDPNDYSKTKAGGASGVASTATAGNAMMRWPVMWVSRTWVGGKYQFRVASEKVDDSYQCWANLNAVGEAVPFYTPIYFGSKDGSGRLRSLSGQTNWVSTGGAQPEIDAAKANGNGWHTERIVDRWLINDLLVMLAKNLNTQAVYGQGHTASGNSAAIAPGTMDTRGLFWGSSNGTDGVKVFGMENWWGNLYRRVAGWVMVSGTQKVKLTEGTQDGSTATGYNLTGDGYISIPGSTPSGSSGGFISGYLQTGYGLVPGALSGSETTYACDKMWFDTSGTRYAIVGGYWAYAAHAGAFCASLNYGASDSDSIRGAAPSYK